MPETTKTALLILLALLFLFIAWTARPAARAIGKIDDSGQRFFAEFDPLEATSLQIIDFDEDTGTPLAFKVAQVNGVWSIPSHESYPADAQNQLAEAAAAVVDLIKGPSVSDRPARHELFGVIDPLDASAGATGVGTQVTFTNQSETVLAQIIIGNPVKDKPDLRYVREPGKKRVYTTQVRTDTLSTNFEDWIERDLLKLDPSKIVEVIIDDYSIDEVRQRLNQGQVLTLNYDGSENLWGLDGLGADEELVTEKLDDLKRALDDLKIVDVHRKPAGLSAELQAQDQLVLDQEAMASLQGRGFYIYNARLISNEGETRVGTEGGVQYVLRFGEIALGGRRAEDETGQGAASSAGANRYLFITAQLNTDLIPKPELAQLPDIPLEESDDGADTSADTQPQTPTLADTMEDARKKIEEDNQRAQEEYEQKLAAAGEKVKELNKRFADWYYVISDDVYQKIRLRRAAVVKQKEPEGEASTESDEG